LKNLKKERFTMPLKKGKSKKAFQENVSKLRDEGKPLNQALAIAFDIKKKASGKKKKTK
jgi:hypothetical protein